MTKYFLVFVTHIAKYKRYSIYCNTEIKLTTENFCSKIEQVYKPQNGGVLTTIRRKGL